MSKWWKVAFRATTYTVPLLALAIVLYSHAAGAVTTVPTKMNFQGRLTDSSGSIMPNGTYNMKLRLFTASSGGSSVWSEDRLVSAAQGVQVTNGLFSVQLGDISALSASLFASGALYLEVELPTPGTATSSSPSWTEGAMTPRNQLATSAYAYNAETLDGMDSSAFAQLSQSNVWTGTNTIQASNTSAFAIQNSTSVNVLRVDTTGEVGNTITNGSVEIDASGWSALGASTLSRTTSTAYYGEASVQVATTTSANDGAKYAVTLSDSTQYTASFYAKLSTGTFTAMSLGYSNDGTTVGETNCKSGVTIVTGGWTQVNCTFTTPGSHSGTPYFYIKQPFGGTARTFYIDGFHMIPGPNIGAYYDGQIKTSAIFNHIAVQDAEDSVTAFQVQAANGTSVFDVDTINKRVGIGTNSPNARLQVNAITSSSIGLIVKGVNSQTGNLAEFQDVNNNVLSGVTAQGNIFSTGDTRANINSLGTPTEGTITYDQTNDRLLVYSNGKWQADRNDAVLVAASDSSQSDKDAADYVADGTADDVEIQSALNSADPSAGTRKTGKVYLFAGTYNISTSVTIKNNTTIAGAGRGTLLSLISTTSAVKVLTNNDTTTGTGVTIQNLRIDGSNGTVGAQYGIYLDNMGGSTGSSSRQGAKVENVVLLNFNTANMYLNSSSHGTFANISSQGSDGDGIGLSSSFYNTFTGNTVSGNSGDGFDVSASHDDTFSGNTIQNNSGAGINSTSSSYSLSISGNTFRQNGANGITLSQHSYSSISSNSFYSNTGDGINVVGGASSAISISGNSIYNSTGDGIDLTATHSTITGNVLISNTNGILVQNGSNTITGNTTRSNSTAGISLNGTSADNNVVSANTVSANTQYGIYLSGADTNNISGNRIFDNGGLTTNNGIYLTNSDTNYIQSNTLTDGNASSNDYAINIFSSNCDNNIVSSNSLGTTATINDSGTGTTYPGQLNSAGDYALQPAGDISLLADTNVKVTSATALNVQDGSANSLLVADTSAMTVNIDGKVDIQGITLSSTTGNGANVGVAFNLVTANGQETTGTTGQTAGNGGAITITAGNGGNAASGSSNGWGGNISLQAGSKGSGTGTAGLDGTVAINPNGVGYFKVGNVTAPDLSWGILLGRTTYLNSNFLQRTTSTTAFRVQDGSGNSVFSVDTSNKTVNITGDTRTNINSIGSPTEGMITYDQTNDRMLLYSNGKWQADRNDAVLVAASDSSQVDKDAADYVADGTADQSEINSALTAASSSGSRKTGKVYLFAGTYTISASITVPNNVTIAGSGNGTVITIPNSLNTVVYGITNSTTGGAGEGISIRDIRLEGNQANQSSGTMYGVFLNGIASNGTVKSGANVTNIVSNGWRTANIALDSTGYSRITNSSSTGAAASGISVISSTNNQIANNTIDLGSATGTRGILLSGGSNNTITGNSVKNFVLYGIYAGLTSGNTISGNTVDGDGTNSIEGIYVYNSSTKNTISGNSVEGNASGILLITSASSNAVTGNTVYNNSSTGIYIDSSNLNIVSDNNIYDNGGASNNQAIELFSANSNTITGNSISDTSATTTNYAIDISSGTSNYLADNYLDSGSVNDSGTSTVQGGQLQSGSTFDINGGGNTIRLDSAEVVLSQNLLRSSPTSNLTLQGGTGGGSAIILNADATSANNGVIIQNGYLRSSNGTTLTIRAGNNGSANMVLDAANIDLTQGLGGGNGVTAVCINGTNRLKAATSVCANPSSIAYKENVKDMGSTLDLLSRLRPVSFDWKDDVRYTAQNGGKSDFGLIAQDVQGVIPTLVSYNEDGSVQGLNYSGFVPFLIKGVQEQQSEIGQLQGDILAIQAINQHQQNQITAAKSTNDAQQTSINNLKNSVSSLVQNAATTNLSDGSMDIAVDGATFGGGVVMNGSLNVSGTSTVGELTVTKSLAVAKDLTVGGSITTTDITVNGHIITGGSAPEIVAKPGIGTADAANSIAAPTVVINGNDTSGTITITAGANGLADAIARITFAKPFESTPRIVLSAANRASVSIGAYYDASNASATGFDLMVDTAPQPGKTYVFNYYIVQ